MPLKFAGKNARPRVLKSVFNWRGSLWIISDHLRYFAAKLAPHFMTPARQICFALGASRTAFSLTMLQHRLTSSDAITMEVRTRLPEMLRQLESSLTPPSGRHTVYQHRAIILRSPEITQNCIKKGVLLITFTETFQYFHYCIDIERLLRYFRIVLEPSWSGYCLPEILLWSKYNEPIIVQASEARDRRFLQSLGTCLIPISVGASDWVDHRIFHPLNLPKEYDVIYVANLSPIKRVHVYLRALRALILRGRNVRAALVLSRWGGDKTTLEHLLRLYDLGDRIEVFMNLSQPALNEILNRSKVSLLLSKKEGSNRTLFESMFANVPVLLLRDNIGVNKDYINADTGLLVSEDELPEAITHIGSMSPPLSPRAWAMSNISPEVTTQKLQIALESQPSHNRISTTSLWVKVNSPEATYMDPVTYRLVPDITKVLGCFERDETRNEPISALDVRVRQLFNIAAPNGGSTPPETENHATPG